MITFRCARFPSGLVPVRTSAGIVHFQDGLVEVTDTGTAAALRAVPAVFRITEDTPLAPTVPDTAADVRVWAKNNLVKCPSKGRIPGSVWALFNSRKD